MALIIRFFAVKQDWNCNKSVSEHQIMWVILFMWAVIWFYDFLLGRRENTEL